MKQVDQLKFGTLIAERPADHVLLVTLNRPDRRNAFNTQMAEELIGLWQGLAGHTGADIRAVVMTGAGDKAFCAGADLKERHGMSASDWRRQHRTFERMSYDLMKCPVPVIAAVEGAAFAGGFELMLGCAFAYASKTARFALTETTLGLIPGIGGTQLLPRRVGTARALEILATGKPFGAQDAYDWGIVNRLCEPGNTVSDALETANAIAANAPLAVMQAQRAVRDGVDLNLNDGLAAELRCYETLVDTADRKEGIVAFNEKRKPEFRGH